MFEFFSRIFKKQHNPAAVAGNQWTGTAFVDAYKRNRVPTPNETLAELKNTAFTCASINAAVCASYSPRLFVSSRQDDPQPKCATKSISPQLQDRLKRAAFAPNSIRRGRDIQEVLEHPLLTLLEKVNPNMNAFDLWELTTFYQEVLGSCYWYIQLGSLGIPEAIWILPSQNMTPKRNPGSENLVDYYEYRVGAHSTIYDPKDVIHFRYPDPKDPYTSGLGPLRAAWEQCSISSDYLAFKKATWENTAVPAAVISPDEVIGEEERDRLEAQWNAKFRRGGSGRALVAESGMKVSVLSHSMGDVAALAEYGATKEEIANAFHVPLSYLSSNTNLANLQAAERQHLSLAISPRLWRRDQKINECLIPFYDKSGRLFVASDDPNGADVDRDPAWFGLNMTHGINTINEVRIERGLQPVSWGDAPWFGLNMAPANWPKASDIPQDVVREDYYRNAGRARLPKQALETAAGHDQVKGGPGSGNPNQPRGYHGRWGSGTAATRNSIGLALEGTDGPRLPEWLTIFSDPTKQGPNTPAITNLARFKEYLDLVMARAYFKAGLTTTNPPIPSWLGPSFLADVDVIAEMLRKYPDTDTYKIREMYAERLMKIMPRKMSRTVMAKQVGVSLAVMGGMMLSVPAISALASIKLVVRIRAALEMRKIAAIHAAWNTAALTRLQNRVNIRKAFDVLIKELDSLPPTNDPVKIKEITERYRRLYQFMEDIGIKP